MEKKLTFPEGFLWGVGTAAFQVESNITNNWSVWCEQNAERLAKEAHTKFGRIHSWEYVKDEAENPQNYIPGRASEFEKRYEEDLDTAQSLNQNAFRFSIEWARVEPEEGRFDEDAIRYYQNLTRAIRARGMEPMLTLWWWTDPIWITKKGGWENAETMVAYIRYVRKMAESLRDENIRFWQPMNEPGNPVGMGYVKGEHPPQVKSLRRANRVFKNLMTGYRGAYDTIHEILPGVQVGISHYARFMMPYKNHWWNKLVVRILDYIRNWRFLDTIEDKLDFIGIQYYRTNLIRVNIFQKGYLGIIDEIDDFTNTTDMGWSMYPEGLYHILKRAARYGKDIYITENGIADVRDNDRAWWIRENLRFLHQAMKEGVPVKGYFHWALLDNFEWDKGYWPRFGLVAIDYQTQTRTVRDSAYTYAKICKDNALIVTD